MRRGQAEGSKSLKQTSIDFLTLFHCNCTDSAQLSGAWDVNETEETFLVKYEVLVVK